jgi:uncharacterized membrane protein
MNGSRLPALTYFLMLILGLLQWAHVYPRLPGVMASHFAADGTPNGYQSKQAFFILMFVILGLSAFIAFVTPRILASKAPERLNLPNKSYWLSPEHRAETFRFVRAQMAWFGCAILFVLLYGTSLAVNANLPPVHRFDSNAMLYVMAGFALFCGAWCILFVRHFMKIPTHSLGSPQQ